MLCAKCNCYYFEYISTLHNREKVTKRFYLSTSIVERGLQEAGRINGYTKSFQRARGGKLNYT